MCRSTRTLPSHSRDYAARSHESMALFRRIDEEPSRLAFCAFHCQPGAVNISPLLSLPAREFGASIYRLSSAN